MTTKADLERYDLIQRMGCVACRMSDILSQCDVHHLNLAGRAGQPRLGNQYTIGLCPWHHRGVLPDGMSQADTTAKLGPSLALSPRRFRAEFGTDEGLLGRVNAWIKSRRTA